MKSKYFKELKQKIELKEMKICIIGLGYVGLPLSLLFANKNVKVIGLDIDEEKIKALKSGRSYINHIKSSSIKKFVGENFFPSTNFQEVSKSDVIIICVPTPLNKNREPDLTFIENTMKASLPYFKEGQLISLESTTYPGTTDEVLAGFLSNKNFKLGENFFLSYSPEREDPGNTEYPSSNIPKIVSGYTKACLDLSSSLYKIISNSVHRVSSTKAAEMTKLLENIYRSVNIGLVNEMKLLCHQMDINIYEVIEAASSKPFGFHPHFPGPGIGGHCIPIDPFYLTWKAREYGMNTKFIELAGEINQSMPSYVFSRLIEALNSKGKAIKGSKINILGLAYKKNVDDQRESPSVELMEIIKRNGGIVSYSDPFIPKFKPMRDHKFNLRSQKVTKSNLVSYDAVILCTDHDQFDYDLIIKNANLLVDTRGVYSKGEFNTSKHINVFSA